MTYGEEQETASAALLALLEAPAPAPSSGAVILALRRQVHLALLDRLGLIGLSRHLDKPARDVRQLDTVRHPLHTLERVLRSLPTNEIAESRPSVLLTRKTTDQAVESWRSLARHLTLANAELSGAPSETWERTSQTWYLLGDLASTIEALAVLDERLGDAGLLTRITQNAYLHHRLNAGDVARIAGWLGTEPTPDLAYLSPIETLGAGGGPRIQLVRRTEDFVRAQRALAGFMRPRNSFDPNLAETERPGILAARTIAQGQVRLAEVFARWAERANESKLADGFRARIPLYAELHRSTVRLVELQPTKSPLVVAQQSEMVQRTRALAGARLSPAGLFQLERATGHLTVSVGKTLRREGMQRRHLLVRDDERLDLNGARPITNTRERFNVACRALVAGGSSAARTPQPSSQRNRARLSERLRFSVT